MKKRVMILGASEIQVPIIEKCNSLGYESVVVDYNPEAPGLRLAAIPIAASTNDEIAVLQKAQELQIDGILTTSDFPVRVVAYVARQLNLPALTEESAFLTTNKFELRRALKEAGLHVPSFHILSNPEDTRELTGFPYVVKPVDSSGSRGVRKVNSRHELLDWLPQALDFSHSKKAIAEKFIEGAEFSVESLCQNGEIEIIAITEKRLLSDENGFFVESAHIIPSLLDTEDQKEIEKVTKRAIQTLGIDNAACHTELRLNNGRCTIIEVGARLGGDFIGSDLVPLATGIDMLKAIIDISLGIPYEVPKRDAKAAAIQFLDSLNYSSATQYVRGQSDIVEKYAVSPFREIESRNSFDRLGYVILRSQDRTELEKALELINLARENHN